MLFSGLSLGGRGAFAHKGRSFLFITLYNCTISARRDLRYASYPIIAARTDDRDVIARLELERVGYDVRQFGHWRAQQAACLVGVEQAIDLHRSSMAKRSYRSNPIRENAR
jgi:hypothetical protein